MFKMISNTQILEEAQTVQRAIEAKENLTPIEVREIAEILEKGTEATYIRLWKWQELGIVKYVAGNKGHGNWYWIGLKNG